jgi:FHA domain-containing protein
MNHSFMALAFQDAPDNSSMWIIIAAVLVILVFIVVIIGVGLTIFFVMRKRSKAQKVPATSAVGLSSGPSSSPLAGMSSAEPAQVGSPLETPPPAIESFPPLPETSNLVSPEADLDAPSDFDPQRTVAISREPTVAISYGTIKFVSGVLAGEQFDVKPEGSYIGRESTLSQIVVSDPRISKRHLWIGVRDGLVRIIDQDSRNGTFVNDPKSERVTEATLNSGDTVIMGESDVARFEYQM